MTRYQQGFDFIARAGIVSASLFQVSRALRRRLYIHCLAENTFNVRDVLAPMAPTPQMVLYQSVRQRQWLTANEWDFFKNLSLLCRLRAADFAVEPGLGKSPVPISRARKCRQPRRPVRWRVRRSSAVPPVGLVRVALRKPCQSLIEGQHPLGGQACGDAIRVQLQALPVTAVLWRGLCGERFPLESFSWPPQRRRRSGRGFSIAALYLCRPSG